MTKSRKRGAIHMVSAFSAANNVVLGQVKTAEKSNEITAIPELIKLLELRGCLVTLHAMGCQREIAKTIIEKDADYLLAVKGNQGRLEHAFKKHFSAEILSAWKGDHYLTSEFSHGRLENRMYIVSDIFVRRLSPKYASPKVSSAHCSGGNVNMILTHR